MFELLLTGTACHQVDVFVRDVIAGDALRADPAPEMFELGDRAHELGLRHADRDCDAYIDSGAMVGVARGADDIAAVLLSESLDLS